MDLLAILLEEGLVDAKGRFVPLCSHSLSPRIVGSGREVKFFITERICLTQSDVRELQVAKAAIRAGIEILLEKAKITPQEIQQVYLAGAFGSQMRPNSLATIGLIPKELLPKVRLVGNAAGAEAIITLLNRNAIEEARDIAKSTEYIELSHEKEFSEAFVAYINFET